MVMTSVETFFESIYRRLATSSVTLIELCPFTIFPYILTRSFLMQRKKKCIKFSLCTLEKNTNSSFLLWGMRCSQKTGESTKIC